MWNKSKRGDWFINGCNLKEYQKMEAEEKEATKKKQFDVMFIDLIGAMRRHKLDTTRYVLSKLRRPLKNAADCKTIVSILLGGGGSCLECNKREYDSATHFDMLRLLLQKKIMRGNEAFIMELLQRCFDTRVTWLSFILFHALPQTLRSIQKQLNAISSLRSVLSQYLDGTPLNPHWDTKVVDIKAKRNDNPHLLLLRITEVCMALRPLGLPPYVLLEIIEHLFCCVSGCGCLTHKQKIDQIVFVVHPQSRTTTKRRRGK